MVSKKKKVFTEIETDFSAKIGNSNIFSAPKQVVSKKKRSSSKLRLIFQPISEIQMLFLTASRDLLHNFGTQFPLGGCFQFFTKNRPQKHQKRAILHTSQANGGGLEPPPPPLATLLLKAIFILTKKEITLTLFSLSFDFILIQTVLALFEF